MRSFIIKEETVVGLIRYLETKPYKESAPAIQLLQQLPEQKSAEDTKPDLKAVKK